jgi:8-oxo-dGTP diphosphatase
MADERIRVVAAVIEREGRYLITQRRAEAVLGNLWEFPGGKVEPGEADEAALARELGERLGVHGSVGRKLGEKHHAYEGYEVEVALYAVTLREASEPSRGRIQDFRWVRSDEFDQYPFPDADQKTMDQLLGFRRK